jgi:segregation and condensation protein B
MNRSACGFLAPDFAMSLKAKLEAVVYAAEEPVTLAQLAVIFADELLLTLEEASHSPDAAQLSLNGIAQSGTAEDGAPEAPVEDAPPAQEAPEARSEQADPGPEVVAAEAGSPATEGNESETEVEGGEAADSEAVEKKLARQRDRKLRQELQKVLDELIADYANSDRGMEIREIAGGYRMATKPEYHDAVRGFVKSLKPPMKLSLQALETLAVIAYKQPVTAPEVSEIRGVDSGGVLGSLVSRKLITTAGRKPVIGRPILYKTTKEFLLRFGLKDVNDLPSMEEFEKMAGELAETEAEPELQASLPDTEHPSTGEGEPSTPDEELHAEASQTAEPPAVEEGAATPETESSDTVIEPKV